MNDIAPMEPFGSVCSRCHANLTHEPGTVRVPTINGGPLVLHGLQDCVASLAKRLARVELELETHEH